MADILESADLIVGYNLEFDMDMLIENGLPDVDTRRYDLMDEYAQAYGRWSDRKEDYLWVKLEQCARHYGYGFDAHNALEDAKATAFCLQRFMEECAAEIPTAQEREEMLRVEKAERERVAKQKQEEMSKGIDRQYRLLIAIVAICLLGGGAPLCLFAIHLLVLLGLGNTGAHLRCGRDVHGQRQRLVTP